MKEETASRKDRGRALVAGGNPELRRTMAAQLGEGFEFVTEAAGRQEIEAMSREAPIDIVLLHSRLALDQKGDLLQQLKARPGSPPIIVFGSYDEMEFVEKMLDLGASAYLPVWRVADLLQPTVERILRRRGGRGKG